jgi:hypothetical protein
MHWIRLRFVAAFSSYVLQHDLCPQLQLEALTDKRNRLLERQKLRDSASTRNKRSVGAFSLPLHELRKRTVS